MFTLYASSIWCAAQCTPCTAQCTPCTAQCTPCTAGCSCRRRAMTPLFLPTMTLAPSLPKPTSFSCHSVSATPRLVITVEMAAKIPWAFTAMWCVKMRACLSFRYEVPTSSPFLLSTSQAQTKSVYGRACLPRAWHVRNILHSLLNVWLFRVVSIRAAGTFNTIQHA